MKKYNDKTKKGISIIGVVFLGVILVFILSFFKISIRSVVKSPYTQDNIIYITENSRSLWNDYLKEPVLYIWNDILLKFGKPAINNLLNNTPNNSNVPNTNINTIQDMPQK